MPKISLTDITVRNLQAPPSGQITFWDEAAGFPGFGIRVSQGGAKTFIVMLGATRQRITVGRYPVLSLSKAREQAKIILAEHTLGKHRPANVTFDVARDEFLKSRDVRPRTLEEYTRLLTSHFPFGKTRLSEIAPQDVSRKLDKIKRPAEKSHAFVVAKMFFKWAVDRNYLAANPVKGSRPTKPQARDRVLSDAELAAIYKTAKAYPYPFGPIVLLCLLTGQRRGEIAQFEWEWIDSDTITIPSEVTKNGREHTFPIGKMAVEVIGGLPKLGDHLFPAAKERRKGQKAVVFAGWSKSKAAFDKKLNKVAPWTLHDLRRTFATTLAALGTPVHVTEKLLNHISGTISGVAAVYNRHLYMDEMREAIERWDQYMAELLRRQTGTTG